jgi:hypothetical protein
MIIKNLGLMIFNSYPVRIMDVSGILRSIGFFINNLLILYSSNLFMALNGSTALGIFELLSLISSLLLICLIFARYKKFDDSKIKNIYLLGILIILSILIPYMLVFGINQSTERYLTIIIVFTFMLISFLYLIEDKYKKITIFLILCLMLVNMLNNFNYVDKLNYHPNNDEYELISYLKLNNLSYGYGNYWDANINTYLSKEDVVIRPVYFSEDGIRPMRQISDEDWYDSIPNQYFIILNNNNINEVISFNNMLYSHPPETIYSYKNYNIYKYYRDESTGNMLLFN